ncbi:DUF7522 family protein [Halorubrum sp. DTA98]|uniref:DUF7522 family protein n=1 Tax=Halorubrum sp. DTA98 TaxID=3402163 RepID=UPI003AB0353F
MTQSTGVHRDELLSAARTAVGDELRSLTYFTEESVDQLYLRNDLDRTADLVGFAESERHGFHAQALYANTQLGNYRFTVRVFDNGYLTRVIANGHGIWVTTDSMEMDRFEELASALAAILRSFDPV